MHGLIGVVLEFGISEIAIDFCLVDNRAGRRPFATGIEVTAFEPVIQKPIDIALGPCFNAMHHPKNRHEGATDVFEEDFLQKWQIIHSVCAGGAAWAHGHEADMWMLS